MQRIRFLLVIFFFYLFAVLQNSFFTHFNLFGAYPDLVFALFFTVIFFEKKENLNQVLLYSILAGFFLDVFSFARFGQNIIILLAIAFLLKKAQELLIGKNYDYPFIYFLPLFFIALLVYYGLSAIFTGFNSSIIMSAIYNLIVASAFFFAYKKFLASGLDDRQLKLFQ